jgi:hypothetical protein
MTIQEAILDLIGTRERENGLTIGFMANLAYPTRSADGQKQVIVLETDEKGQHNLCYENGDPAIISADAILSNEWFTE